jgi:hypothetical protein
MAWSDWVGVATTGVLGAAGLYFANSVRRRARAELDREVTAKRFAAYGAMWSALEKASPMARRRIIDRRGLFEDLTSWYYQGGNGMLLSPAARSIYLTAKENLLCQPEAFVPARARAAVEEADSERDRLVIRQFSLLRTAMRGDVALYTTPWGSPLTDEDIAFLLACGVDISREPWRRSLPRQWNARQRRRLAELKQTPPDWLKDSAGPFAPGLGPEDVEVWERSALTADDIQRRLRWSR